MNKMKKKKKDKITTIVTPDGIFAQIIERDEKTFIKVPYINYR